MHGAHARATLFGLLAVLHSWPLASDLAHLSRLDNDDAALNTWIVAWTAHILPIAPWRLFDAPIFYPEAYSLAYTDLILVPSLMGAPRCCLTASSTAATIPWTCGFLFQHRAAIRLDALA